MDFYWEPYHFSQATGLNKPQQAHDRSGTRQRKEKLQRKSRSVSHFFTQQQSTSMTTSWHLYLVARFSRVSASSTRRTYSCSTCKGQENVSAPFHRYDLPHSFTPVPKPFKVAGQTGGVIQTPNPNKEQDTSRGCWLTCTGALFLCKISTTRWKPIGAFFLV